MNKRFRFLAKVTACVLPLALSSAASAHWGKTTITDGNGDGVQIQHHLLGQKDVRAQDQLGDGFVYKRGLFGVNRTEGISVLGNGMKIHHGLISGTSVEGQSMFGDSIKSKKIFGIGPRNTTVDLHGVSSVASSIFGHHNSGMPGYPGMSQSGMNPAMNGAGMSPGYKPEDIPGVGPGGNLGGLNPTGMPEANSGMRPGMVDPNAYASPPGQ